MISLHFLSSFLYFFEDVPRYRLARMGRLLDAQGSFDPRHDFTDVDCHSQRPCEFEKRFGRCRVAAPGTSGMKLCQQIVLVQ
jgi:hypothetical protein